MEPLEVCRSVGLTSWDTLAFGALLVNDITLKLYMCTLECSFPHVSIYMCYYSFLLKYRSYMYYLTSHIYRRRRKSFRSSSSYSSLRTCLLGVIHYSL